MYDWSCITRSDRYLGGLVVKEAVVIAKNNDNFKEIREATSSLVLFAVPHQGVRGTTLGTIARNIVTAADGRERNDTYVALQRTMRSSKQSRGSSAGSLSFPRKETSRVRYSGDEVWWT